MREIYHTEATAMNEKNVMSIGKQIKYLKTFNGIAWIGTGIFEIFDNIPCEILTIICLLCSVFLLVRVQTATKEAEDEMAERNLIGARALTQMQMHILFCIAAVLLMFLVKMPLPFSINWKQAIIPVFFIIMGIEDLLIGIHFKRLEEE
jgi:hypothetical protein